VHGAFGGSRAAANPIVGALGAGMLGTSKRPMPEESLCTFLTISWIAQQGVQGIASLERERKLRKMLRLKTASL